jgi:glycine/D-amino acid oxidase-like deaminating enzyme
MSALRQAQDYDIAVIGAGIAGASIAAELAPHARVLIAEAEDTPGYHTTGRSAAFFHECYRLRPHRSDARPGESIGPR